MSRNNGILRFAISFLIFLQFCTGDDNGGLSPINDDVLGLIVFKSELHDPSSFLSSWNEDDDSPCSWEFIQCNPLTGRVSEVSINGVGLSGRIGRGLEKLQSLKTLSLSDNNLSGIISSELRLPRSVERLNLSNNRLSGNLPISLVDMNSIRFLDFSANLFSGNVPDNMFDNCSSLHFLSLAGNMLEGSFPTLLSRCFSINTLNLSGNHFSGEPDFSAIYSLNRLRSLDLSKNDLTGSVPEGISSIHNLKELSLQKNQFSGTIPADIGLCPHLSRLDLSHNHFSGTLPESLRLLNSLSFFGVADNELSGEFPQWIGNMSGLEYIDFGKNSFSGNLPFSLGKLRLLNYLSLSSNKLSGIIPPSMAFCTKLSIIKLGGNSFNGSIPGGLFQLGLDEVDLSDNELAGSIPSGSSRLFEFLRRLDLSMNKIKGNFPADMGLYTNLRYLNLSWNSLHAKIPRELGFFQNLTVVDLRESSLFGSIPGDICYSGSLEILQLDGNFFSGSIPAEIENCSSLYLLSLSRNNFTGSIPVSISKLNKLKILKLEFNEFSGEIPQELGKMESLLIFNASYNRLVGRLPVGGLFQSLDQSSLQGNMGICSPLLKGPCTMDVPKPLVLDPDAYAGQMGDRGQRNQTSNSVISDRRHMFFSVSAIVAICAATLIACGVIVISLLNVSARRRSLAYLENAMEESKFSSSLPSISSNTGKFIMFDSKSTPQTIENIESLLNKESEIGEGAFGKVYKVPLNNNREANLAVRKLVGPTGTIQYLEDFDREIRVLEKAKHPNLVLIRGYCWTPQIQLLISEFVTNGSLQAKLHERPSSILPLSWTSRFKIVMGTAKGLAHLHHACHPAIIHFNIKPSNILIDKNDNPKISNYGLAKLATKLGKDATSNRFESNSLGYVAPELACKSLRVNEKCDVYGFGVVILEIVTGRRAVEYGDDNVVVLIDHVKVLLDQGNVLGCVDPSLGEFEEEEVVPLLKLALVCTTQIPPSRPSMAEVVQILQVIKTSIPHRREAF